MLCIRVMNYKNATQFQCSFSDSNECVQKLKIFNAKSERQKKKPFETTKHLQKLK